jgi:PAS domain S-box-containing protein
MTRRQQADEQVWGSEERFRLLVEEAKDYAIFLLDPDGHVASWNAGAERIKQYRADEIIGQHFSRFYPQEAIERGWPAHELKVARAEGRFEDEGWRIRKDGTQFWANVVITALHDETGKFCGFSKITRDLSERKKAEENARRLAEEAAARKAAEHMARVIREQREQLHVTLQSIGDGVIAVDADGRVQLLNSIAQTLTGWTLEEARGRPLPDVFRLFNEHTRQPVENPALRALKDQVPVGLANHTVLVAKDGRELPIDDTAAPIRGENGTILGAVLVFRNVSEQRQVEDRLRRSEQRFAQFMQHLPGLAWIKDLQGRYVFANDSAEKAFQIARDRLYGRTDEEIFPPDTARQFRDNDQRAIDSGDGVQVVESLEHMGGDIRFSLVSKFPIAGPAGETMLVGGMAIDITEQRRVEQALRESEERFRALMEQAPFGIQVLAPDGHTVRVNRSWEKLWGVTFDEIADYNILEDPHLEAKGVTPYIRRAFAGEAVTIPAFEYDPNEIFPERMQHEDARRWVSAVAYPLMDATGQVREVVLVHDDITARRRAEDEREKFAFLVQNSHDFIGMCDRNFMPFFINEAGLRLVGLDSVAEACRTPVQEFFFPEDQEFIIHEFFPQVLRDGYGYVEVRFRHFKTGEARWMVYGVLAIKDSAGECIGLATISRDISARREAEEAWKRSERLYRAIGESIDYGVWLCDREGRNVYTSESFLRLVGLTQEQCSAFGWGDVLHPDDAARSIAAWKECVRNGGQWDVEHRFRGVDGQWHPILARGVPVKDDQGEIIAWAGINLDISRLKQVEDKLRDADRRKDEFLATLAHELRNPLAAIRNSLQILKMPHLDAETAQQTRDTMERQVHHLVRLVDDLLDVSRVMRGKIELRREPVELATVIARAVETANPFIELQGHQLEISTPKESLLLDADPVRLAQVVGNLLTNSAKYTEANGHIWLSARREGDQAILVVRDTGIGIAPDVLPHIFELFVQADHASTRAQGGLGIGLTLVKNLVEMHDGNIEAYSCGLGKGSEFVIRLPLMAQERQNLDDQSTARHDSPSGKAGRRLLVVDDNQDAAISFSMLLSLQGHDVQVAHDGPSALERVMTFRPDMIFLDIGMPGMDGYEVARRVRQTPELANTVLVALTGWGQDEHRRRTAEAGFDYHLVKPPEPKAVESLLADLASEKK